MKDIKRVSLILDDDDEQLEELGLTGLTASGKQSGVRYLSTGYQLVVHSHK